MEEQELNILLSKIGDVDISICPSDKNIFRLKILVANKKAANKIIKRLPETIQTEFDKCFLYVSGNNFMELIYATLDIVETQ